MSTYVIGDVQGCYDTLVALLKRVSFDRKKDRAWFVGDLVNRGPKSLEVLRFIKDLGRSATAVLGNHDLHLIGRHAGIRRAKDGDTLDAVLAAPDAEALIQWLAERPLLFREGPVTLVHAGLRPEWTLADAERAAVSLATRIRDPNARRALYERDEYPPELKALATIRTCHVDGTLCKHNGTPETAPKGCHPWFEVAGRKSHGESTILFGHWSALGYRKGDDYVALDSGCVWGRTLTAYRLEDGRTFSEPAVESPARD